MDTNNSVCMKAKKKDRNIWYRLMRMLVGYKVFCLGEVRYATIIHGQCPVCGVNEKREGAGGYSILCCWTGSRVSMKQEQVLHMFHVCESCKSGPFPAYEELQRLGRRAVAAKNKILRMSNKDYEKFHSEATHEWERELESR